MIRKEKVQLTLFTDSMTTYLKTSNIPITHKTIIKYQPTSSSMENTTAHLVEHKFFKMYIFTYVYVHQYA